ncbi:MAG: hypothetical protein ACXWC6_10390 [Ramlibacter sp.]
MPTPADFAAACRACLARGGGPDRIADLVRAALQAPRSDAPDRAPSIRTGLAPAVRRAAGS